VALTCQWQRAAATHGVLYRAGAISDGRRSGLRVAIVVTDLMIITISTDAPALTSVPVAARKDRPGARPSLSMSQGRPRAATCAGPYRSTRTSALPLSYRDVSGATRGCEESHGGEAMSSIVWSSSAGTRFNAAVNSCSIGTAVVFVKAMCRAHAGG
jgi:hypothetical protein